MNQILVTEKLYVTPELRRKKNTYRIVFFIAVFAIVALALYYVYIEFDKSKQEDLSQDILTGLNSEEVIANQENGDVVNEKVWKILSTPQEQEEIVETEEENVPEIKENDGMITAANGKKYKTVGSINIPKIKVNYPILADTSVALLKIAPCKFFGPNPNEVGNLCVAGHNYKNNQFFSKVPKNIKIGDLIQITDLSGRTLEYSVYDRFEVYPEDTSYTSQLTNGNKIVTLITCTDDNKKRVIIQAKEIV